MLSFVAITNADSAHAQNALHNILRALIRHEYLRVPTTNYYAYSEFSDANGVTCNYVQGIVNYFAQHSIYQKHDTDAYGSIGQTFSTIGWYKRALLGNELYARKLSPEKRKPIQALVKQYHKLFSVSENCGDYIVDQASRAPITMINEAHDYPLNRAFIMKLLKRLHDIGYTHLAMETLARDGNLSALDQTTGFYTSEPVMGELVRYALRIGYELIPYEADITPEMTSIQRDSVQAKNLIAAVRGIANGKILVVAGYDHINELIIDTAHFQPMAYFFKKWSGLNPLTIDQVHLNEFSVNQVSRLIYKFLPANRRSEASCIMTNDVYYNRFINVRNNQERDIYVMLPKTKFRHGRPTWLTLNGLRKRVSFSIPNNAARHTILVQAYYANEITDSSKFDKRVPADQLVLESRKMDLYLVPANHYIVICRDVNNKIVFRQDIRI